MKYFSVSFLCMVTLIVGSVEAKKESSGKIIEYHGSADIDDKTQQVLEQFANAADAIITIGTHPKDKRLIVKKVAQMLADIAKFVVEATRKVCLVDELAHESSRGITDNLIEFECLENSVSEEEMLKKEQEEMLKTWNRMSYLVARLAH